MNNTTHKVFLNPLRSSMLLLLLVFSLPVFSQTGPIKVSGAVKDSTGSALPNVTVYEKGTRNGTLSTPEGNYTLNVKAGAVLVFTMVGFRTQEIETGDRTNIPVLLRTSATDLTDVVIVGYGATT